MLDDDLRHRARRLMAGDFRTGDLDRLFLGQRDRAWGRATFREIGDFIAHRDTREKGLVTQVGKDVFTSVDVWSLKMRGREPSWADIARAAEANLRLASDEQIRSGCGCQRGAAKKRMQAALAKIERQERPTELEIKALDYLGNRFIWKPAFTSDQLFSEFRDVLMLNQIVDKADAEALDGAKAYIVLHALSVMHGSTIVLDGGEKARLFAGFANRDRRLEIKVEIVFSELSKPLMAPVCLFLTNFGPDEHCDPELNRSADPGLFNHWNFPIDVGADGRLSRIC